MQVVENLKPHVRAMSIWNRVKFGVLSSSIVTCAIVALVATEVDTPVLITIVMCIMPLPLAVAVAGTSVFWKAGVLSVLTVMFFGLHVLELPSASLIIWSTVATFAILRFWKRSSDNVTDDGVSGAIIVSIVLVGISLPFSGYPKRYQYLQLAGDIGLLMAMLITIESIVIYTIAVLSKKCVASVFPREFLKGKDD